MPFGNYKSIANVLQDFPLNYEEKLILKEIPLGAIRSSQSLSY